MRRGVRQKGDVPCALDGARQDTLMLGAHAGSATPLDAPTRRDVLLEHIGVFVVNGLDVIGAESADPAPTRPEPAVTPAPRAAVSRVAVRGSAVAGPFRGPIPRPASFRSLAAIKVVVAISQSDSLLMVYTTRVQLSPSQLGSPTGWTSSRRTSMWRSTSSESLSARSSSRIAVCSSLAWMST